MMTTYFLSTTFRLVHQVLYISAFYQAIFLQEGYNIVLVSMLTN